MTTTIYNRKQKFLNPWRFFQQWRSNIERKKEQAAGHIVKLVPAQCPFAREIRVFDRVLFLIPLCKLNPCYEQLIRLRRALCFLADCCEEDITPYYC